jgi:hypothetical protein
MPNGFSDRQIDELNRAADVFVAEHGEGFGEALPSLVMREAIGERVELYEKVEAQLSMLQPPTRLQRKEEGERQQALSDVWARLKKDALKRAKAG